MIKAFLLLLLAIIMTSCGLQTDVTQIAETTADSTVTSSVDSFFMIEGELPTIGAFNAKTQKRFYEEHTTEFIPSKEYGMVLPYVANYKEYSSGEYENSFTQSFGEYGFCMADGTIVMDASSEIRYIRQDSAPDGFTYYDITLKNLDADDYDVFYGETHWLLPISGEWCIHLDDGFYIVGASEGIIVTARYKQGEDDTAEIILYNYNGKKIGSIKGADNSHVFSNGLMRAAEWENNEPRWYYYDVKGEKVLGPFDSATSFNAHGIAVVCEDEEYYLIDTEGKRFTEVGYERIAMLQDNDGEQSVFVLYEEDSNRKHIVNALGELIRTIECETRSVNISFAPDGEIFYYYMPMYGDDQYWYRLADGEKFISKDFSVMPNDYFYTPRLFWNLQEKYHHAILFNTEGETVAVLDDFVYLIDASDDHRYITYQRASDNGQTVYDTVKGEVILSLDAFTQGVFTGENDRYLVNTMSSAVGLYAQMATVSLYDVERREWLFEDCRYINYYKIGDDWYYNVVTENASTLYDGNMNILLRLYQE